MNGNLAGSAMLFDFEFVAQNKASALEILKRQRVPDSARLFLEAAISALDDDTERKPTVVKVSARGHLGKAVGSGDYTDSSANLEVRKIVITT